MASNDSVPLAPIHTSKTSNTICKSLVKTTLHPIKRNLYKIETERIYRVLKDAVRQLNEWKLLTRRVIDDDPLIFSISDVGLRDGILKLQYLIREFKQHHNGSNDEDEGEYSGSNVMTESLKEIFRYLRTSGVSLKTWVKDDSVENLPDDTTGETLCSTLRALGHMAFEKLLTEKEEEMERNKFLLVNMEKTRASLKTIKTLEWTLAEKRTIKEHELNEQDRIIRQCKQQIESITMAATDENNVKLNDAAKLILTNQKNQEHRNTKQGQEIVELQKKLQTLRVQHFNEESEMRKRKFKMATELRNWIRKYDQDMGWRQEELEEVQEANQLNLQQIEELEGHFKKVEEDYNAVMEERRLQKEAEEERHRINIVRNAAAIRIQATWRGYAVRKRIANANRKQTKDKKGKKGKKK